MEKIFFIETDSFLRNMIEKVFKKAETDVYVTENAGDCLYLIEDLKPTRLLVDIESIKAFHMEFFSGLSKLDLACELILVGEKSEAEGFDLGAFSNKRYLTKPLSPTGLIEKVCELPLKQYN